MVKTDFLGVYSTSAPKETKKSLHNSTRVSQWRNKSLFFVWKTNTGIYYSQPINSAYTPMGDIQELDKNLFTLRYVFENSILAVPLTKFVSPQEEEYIQSDDFKEFTSESVDSLYNMRATIKEDDMRKRFNRAMDKVQKHGIMAVKASLSALLSTQKDIVAGHKHMFTDFGIELRKQGQYGLAEKAFQKAYDLNREDPNVLFNLGRLFYETKRNDIALQYLNAAIKIEADHEEALILIKKIKERYEKIYIV